MILNGGHMMLCIYGEWILMFINFKNHLGGQRGLRNLTMLQIHEITSLKRIREKGADPSSFKNS